MILWKSMESLWFSMCCLQWLIEIMYLGACPKVIVNWNNQVEHTHAQQQCAAHVHAHANHESKKKNARDHTHAHMHEPIHAWHKLYWQMCCILIQCAYAYACDQARNQKPTLRNINPKCDFSKKILTILTTAMSKRRGNSLMLARLTMPLEGNICIQRGAFFCENRVFLQRNTLPLCIGRCSSHAWSHQVWLLNVIVDCVACCFLALMCMLVQPLCISNASFWQMLCAVVGRCTMIVEVLLTVIVWLICMLLILFALQYSLCWLFTNARFLSLFAGEFAMQFVCVVRHYHCFWLVMWMHAIHIFMYVMCVCMYVI